MKEKPLIAVQMAFLDNGHHQRITKNRFSVILGSSGKNYDVIYHNSFTYITSGFVYAREKLNL